MYAHGDTHGVGQTDAVHNVESVATGLAADRPITGNRKGAIYFATDTGVLSIWTGTAWLTTTLT